MIRPHQTIHSILRWAACCAAGAFLASTAHAVDAQWASFCDRYTSDAVAHAARARDLKCGYSGARWSTDRAGHFNWCVAQNGAPQQPAMEGSWRIRGLKDCQDKIEAAKAKQPGTGGTATLVRMSTVRDIHPTVNVFNSPTAPRWVVGQVAKGVTAQRLETHPHGWCKLKGVAHGGRDGWISYDHLTNCPAPK